MVGARWEAVVKLIPENGVVIITDENVYGIYGKQFPSLPVITVPSGEDSKQLSVIEDLGRRLIENGIDRSGFLLGIGGGVICDITGFLASVYMRGIRCGYVSTTLLSQVDASTGGKTGVNLGSLKNIIGLTRQPEFVLCDTSMLLTLSDEEYLSGLAELIKTAVIGDRELFGILESNHDRIIRRDTELLDIIVARSVRFKASVVSEDELETGLRRILNFGHTFGHAIELHTGVRHGFAVAAGMELSIGLSVEKGYMPGDEAGRVTSMLSRFGLLPGPEVDEGLVEELIAHDKKRSGSQIYFVYSGGIGRAVTEKTPLSELTAYYGRFRKERTNI